MAFQPLLITDLRGGRNGVDPPLSLRPTECVEALNVDWHGSTIGRKRGGADSLSMASSTMTGKVSALGRHVPTTDETLAELWAADDAATPIINRLAGGSTWAAPTLKDNPTGNGWDMSYASLNGKLFIAYKSAQARLHVWDTATVRRVGLPTPAAPTAANSAVGGTYAATLRYIRVRWVEVVSSVAVRRSEPGPSVSFTPDGAHTGVDITRPTAPGEGETHWEIEESVDNVTFYQIYVVGGSPVGGAAVAIATTTLATDNAVVSLYYTATASAATGTYTAPTSAKFLAADQNRLLMFGDYTSTNKQNRITFSSVVGSLNIGDAERVDTTASSYIDLDENDSGVPTGLVGPVDGNFYVFKYRQVWKLTASGQPLNPYTQKALSKHIGCVGPRAMVVAEDEAGRPAVYWMSHRGPWRYGANGLEYLGHGVKDLLLRGAPNSISVMNLAATKVVCHAVYHEDSRQVWFWVATGASNDPDMKLVYNIGRVQGPSDSDTPVASGWARHTGPSAAARCSVMFSRTVGAAMSFDLKPYIGQTSANDTIYVTDSTTTTDAGTAFQSYVQGKAYAPWGLGNNGIVDTGNILATAQAGVTITQTLTANFGTEIRTSNVSLTPDATETRVFETFEDAALQNAYAFQPQWGDLSAVSAAWSIEAVVIDWKVGDPR